MKSKMSFWYTTLVFLFLMIPVCMTAQEKLQKDSQVTLPWDEFKKLLNMDGDKIVIPLETFRKLIAQTGVKTVPSYSVKDGNVVLSKEEFQKLVDQMKTPVDPATNPPFEYLITKAKYNGKMSALNTEFSGIFAIHVLRSDGYLRIPILQQNMALNEITVDNKPALVVSEGGYHKIIIQGAGEYTVKADFSVKSSLDKGPHKIDLYIQQTPITLLELEVPLKDVDFEIPGCTVILHWYPQFYPPERWSV